MANEFKVKNGLISQEYAYIFGSVKATNLPKTTSPYYYVGISGSEDQLVLARDPYIKVLNEGFGRILTTNDTNNEVWASKDVQLLPRTVTDLTNYPIDNQWQLTLLPSGSTIFGSVSASDQAYSKYAEWNTHFIQQEYVATSTFYTASTSVQSAKVIAPYNQTITVYSFPYADYNALRFEYTAYNRLGSPAEVLEGRSGVIRAIWDSSGTVNSGDWSHTATTSIGNMKDFVFNVNKIGSNIAITVENTISSGNWLKVAFRAFLNRIEI